MSTPQILVIEDNPALCDMIRRRLERRGFNTFYAADGKAGIASARASLPGLILLDMSLPEIDGWAVAAMLKQDPATQAIPIIALTAHAMQGDRERALEAGCDEFETKPVDFDALVEKIQVLIAQ